MEEITTPYGIIDLAADWREFYRREFLRVSDHSADPCLIGLDQSIDDLLGKYFSKAASQIKSGSGAEGDLIHVRMLLADGDSEDFLPDVACGDSYDKVRMWVEHYDGRYDALIVKAFNPGCVALEARYTYLLYSVNSSRSSRTKEDNKREVLKGTTYYDIAKPPRLCLQRNLDPTPTSDSPVNPVGSKDERCVVGEIDEIFNLRESDAEIQVSVE